MKYANMGSLTTLSLDARPDPFEGLIRLPKISPITVGLLGRLTRRDCELPEMTEMVEKDALLSAGVLQLANSAAFARLQPIHSMKHAIAMIGMGTVRRFALAISVSNLFSRFKVESNFSLTRFNVHSVATGTLTELLAEELPVAFPEEAFLAGMLHDVGKLLIAVNRPRQYDDILAINAIRGTAFIECEREILGVDHAELSALAIERWELAAPIRCAARFHHEPERSAAAENVPPGKLGLTMLVNKADAFVNYSGMSVLPPHQTPAEPPSLEFEGFPFPIDRVLSRFVKAWEDFGGLFR